MKRAAMLLSDAWNSAFYTNLAATASDFRISPLVFPNTDHLQVGVLCCNVCDPFYCCVTWVKQEGVRASSQKMSAPPLSYLRIFPTNCRTCWCNNPSLRSGDVPSWPARAHSQFSILPRRAHLSLATYKEEMCSPSKLPLHLRPSTTGAPKNRMFHLTRCLSPGDRGHQNKKTTPHCPLTHNRQDIQLIMEWDLYEQN